MRRGLLRAAACAALLAQACLPRTAWAATLDVSGAYRAGVQSYTNLNLNTNVGNSQSFVTNDARVGFAARGIYLDTWRGEEMTMDVVLGLRALAIAGSTTTLAAPFNEVADHYPSTDFTPFLEKAALEIHNSFGLPLEMVLGRQNFKLASGLLLEDDGVGLTGGSAAWKLPWWSMTMEGFWFSALNSQADPNNLSLYGVSVTVPSQGTWQFSQLFEDDRKVQTQYACRYTGMPAMGCRANRTRRMFSSVRYQLNYGPIFFEGEAAFQLGKAKILPDMPGAPRQVTFDGNAQVMRAKWKQRLYRMGTGIARMTVARGSGDDRGTTDIDEAFFPSMGHRYNGLERKGFGEYFAATPYDAFGGNYSSTTASGLNANASGIIAVGAGFTPPAYKGIALDIDYWLFQAERVRQGKRTLGAEWDFRLRYNLRDVFSMSLTAALFGVGTASNPALGASRKYSFEVFGKF